MHTSRRSRSQDRCWTPVLFQTGTFGILSTPKTELKVSRAVLCPAEPHILQASLDPSASSPAGEHLGLQSTPLLPFICPWISLWVEFPPSRASRGVWLLLPTSITHPSSTPKFICPKYLSSLQLLEPLQPLLNCPGKGLGKENLPSLGASATDSKKPTVKNNP